MARAERWVEVVWEGNLIQDHGKIVNVGSGALGDLPLSWAACTERSDGKASPEELLAAAHAAEKVAQQAEQAAQSPMPCAPTTRLTLKLPWKASHLEGGASICRT